MWVGAAELGVLREAPVVPVVLRAARGQLVPHKFVSQTFVHVSWDAVQHVLSRVSSSKICVELDRACGNDGAIRMPSLHTVHEQEHVNVIVVY